MLPLVAVWEIELENLTPRKVVTNGPARGLRLGGGGAYWANLATRKAM